MAPFIEILIRWIGIALIIVGSVKAYRAHRELDELHRAKRKETGKTWFRLPKEDLAELRKALIITTFGFLVVIGMYYV